MIMTHKIALLPGDGIGIEVTLHVSPITITFYYNYYSFYPPIFKLVIETEHRSMYSLKYSTGSAGSEAPRMAIRGR